MKSIYYYMKLHDLNKFPGSVNTIILYLYLKLFNAMDMYIDSKTKHNYTIYSYATSINLKNSNNTNISVTVFSVNWTSTHTEHIWTRKKNQTSAETVKTWNTANKENLSCNNRCSKDTLLRSRSNIIHVHGYFLSIYT